MRQATLSQVLEFGRMCESGDLNRETVQAIIEQRFTLVTNLIETVTVPDLPAAELIALAKAELEKTGIPFTYFNEDLAAWNFLEGERGKTFEVLVHNFDHDWETSEGRSFQQARGFDGNVAAFIAWVMTKKPMGYFSSIPNDDSRLWRHPADGDLCAPHFRRDDAHREFCLGDVRYGWPDGGSLVAFRAI